MEFIKGRGTRYFFLFVLLLAVLLCSFLLNISLGSVKISFAEVTKIILHKFIFLQDAGGTVNEAVVWKIRLPRAIATVLGGAALAVSGLLLQIFFRNPIVGPYVLGISSGATLFVGLVVLAGLTFGFGVGSPFLLFGAAFLGSLIVMALVLVIANKVKSVVTLLVIGLMVGYLCSAVTSLLMAFAQKEQLHGFVMWTLGSFAGFTWKQVFVVAVIGIPCLLGTLLICKPLNALLLSEDYAKSMGVSIKTFRVVIVVLSSLLAGLITAFAGPVAFIGQAGPHISRLLFGTSDNRLLIPGTVLLGAIITSLCDLAARMLYNPVELPISAVTSFFGAPIVIYLILKRRTLM